MNLSWKPDRMSSIPLYLQIKEFIKEKIENGEWTTGSKIPPQRVLADSLGVNRSTVVLAFDELSAEGLIEGKSGSGTTVINNTWGLLNSSPPPDWNSYVKAGVHQPNLTTIQQINREEFNPNIIRLGTGELSPEFYPAGMMKEVLSVIPDQIKSLGYEEPKGLLHLREQISNYLNTIGIDSSPSAILVVSGALQALQLISIGLLHRGSTVFLENPSYLYSLHVFQSAGMRLWGLPLDECGIQTAAITRLKHRLRGALLYTIPSFHNPTGILMTEERRQELIRICEKEQLPVIEDDVYRELWLDSPVPSPLKELDKNGLVLYLGSLSKALCPGLRIGWVVGPEPVINRLADIKMQTDYGSSSLSQWVAAKWLSSCLYHKHLERVREQLKIRREVALKAIENYLSDLATWRIPKGGFYIWVRITPSLSMQKLFEKALQRGILLNPGYVYDRNDNKHLRISYAYAPLRHLEDGIHQLSDIIVSCCK
ncbi:MAG: PLP-dependent aminotransferase family protein [Bacillota bacterium]